MTPNGPRTSLAARTSKHTNLSARDLALADAVADRVLSLLEQRAAIEASAGLVDAATLARMLGVSRSTVYALADELGAVRLGGGSKPRLRFDPEAAMRAMSCLGSKRSQAGIPNDDGRSAPAADRAPRRLPNRLPKPGSVLAIRSREAA